MNICLLAANCCLRDESSILINLGPIAVLHNISLSHIFFLKLFLDILCSLYQNTLKSEVGSSRIAPFAFVLFLNLTLVAVIVSVSCVDSAVREGDSDDGVDLQAFSHQNEWR